MDYSNGGAVDIGDPGSAAPCGAAMTTYANAAPPPGALFDNAPDAPFPAVTMTTTTGHLIPATRISQVRGGRWVAVDVLMQYGSPIPLDLALQRVAIGRTVFVRREDAKTVLASLAGHCDYE